MKTFFKTLIIIFIFIISYFISYYLTTYLNNHRFSGEKQIEYVVSTQFDRYNPEYSIVDEFVNGVQIRLYEGILNNKTGYVMVVKDIDTQYRYSFLVNARGDLYAKNQLHIDGTTYVPLHRQAYSYHTFLVLYTYNDDQLQSYFPQYYGLFNSIENIHENSQTKGNYMTLWSPSTDVIFNYFAVVGVLYLILDFSYYGKERIKVHYRRKANIVDLKYNDKNKTLSN